MIADRGRRTVVRRGRSRDGMSRTATPSRATWASGGRARDAAGRAARDRKGRLDAASSASSATADHCGGVREREIRDAGQIWTSHASETGHKRPPGDSQVTRASPGHADCLGVTQAGSRSRRLAPSDPHAIHDLAHRLAESDSGRLASTREVTSVSESPSPIISRGFADVSTVTTILTRSPSVSRGRSR
jgi:hypothetical protein